MLGLPILDKALDVVGKFIPDKTKKLEMMAELEKLKLNGEFDLLTGQMEVNKVEASHKSMFVAGWRPFVGWIGGIGLFYTLFHGIISIVTNRLFGEHIPPLDPMHFTMLMTILGGMLGLRTIEKNKGVSTESISPLALDDNGKPLKKSLWKRIRGK